MGNLLALSIQYRQIQAAMAYLTAYTHVNGGVSDRTSHHESLMTLPALQTKTP